MDPWFSYKLDGILKERSWKLSGILNGIDTKNYDPETDSDIYAPYSAEHPEGKAVNKQKLQERLGLEQDALCTVREVLEKVVTDYAILPAKPNMDEFRRAMLVFENHSVIQRIEGRYNQADCRFAILPTILTAVSAERLHEAAAVLRKEENADEEAEENTAD